MQLNAQIFKKNNTFYSLKSFKTLEIKKIIHGLEFKNERVFEFFKIECLLFFLASCS